jgi:signal transduction histidine kinase
MVAAAVRPALSMRLGVAMHVLDVAWIVTLVAVSGGGDSPFTAFFVYAMLAASYRWGLRATLVTGAFAIIAVTLEALFGRAGLLDRGDHLNAVLIRLSYFAVASVLIGLLAEEERRQRLRSQSVARIMSRVRAESGMVASVRAVFEDVLSRLEASRGLLILYEDGGDVASLWHARRPSPGSALLVRLKQETPETCPTFMFPLPASIHAARIRARGGGRLTVEALNRDGVRCPEGGASAQPLLTASFDWDTALCVSQLSGEGWKGRLFVFDPRARDDHALRFLQAVVREVAPALFNLYLQRRLQSRTGSPDRLRVSQLLHDGVIQSLIGLEM